MKAILVIGAGEGQVPLIEEAHRRGLRAIVVSPRGTYRGIDLADKNIEEDIRFPDRILASNELKGEEIVAVVSDQLDEAVPTVAILAEHLGLLGIGHDVALRFTDKYVMRKTAENMGVAVPRCVFIENINAFPDAVAGLRFPMMIKPVDSAASKGVYKVNNLTELIKCYPESRRYSSVGVIVEEFITGREFVVEGFTIHGIPKNLIVGHRDYFNVSGAFIPCATVFRDADSAIDSIETRLKTINLRIIEGFGLKFGLTHAEYIYNDKEDKIYLVEIAARGGGVCISSDLIPAASGVNASSLLLSAALGEQVPAIRLRKGAAAYFCYMLPEGEVVSIEGIAEMQNVPGFIRAILSNVAVGMHIAAVRDKYSRKGPILVNGENKEDCYRAIARIRTLFKVKVRTSAGLKESYWS